MTDKPDPVEMLKEAANAAKPTLEYLVAMSARANQIAGLYNSLPQSDLRTNFTAASACFHAMGCVELHKQDLKKAKQTYLEQCAHMFDVATLITELYEDEQMRRKINGTDPRSNGS